MVYLERRFQIMLVITILAKRNTKICLHVTSELNINDFKQYFI